MYVNLKKKPRPTKKKHQAGFLFTVLQKKNQCDVFHLVNKQNMVYLCKVASVVLLIKSKKGL